MPLIMIERNNHIKFTQGHAPENRVGGYRTNTGHSLFTGGRNSGGNYFDFLLTEGTILTGMGI